MKLDKIYYVEDYSVRSKYGEANELVNLLKTSSNYFTSYSDAVSHKKILKNIKKYEGK